MIIAIVSGVLTAALMCRGGVCSQKNKKSQNLHCMYRIMIWITASAAIAAEFRWLNSMSCTSQFHNSTKFSTYRMTIWIIIAIVVGTLCITGLMIRYLLSEPYRGVGAKYYETRRRFLLTGCASGTWSRTSLAFSIKNDPPTQEWDEDWLWRCFEMDMMSWQPILVRRRFKELRKTTDGTNKQVV